MSPGALPTLHEICCGSRRAQFCTRCSGTNVRVPKTVDYHRSRTHSPCDHLRDGGNVRGFRCGVWEGLWGGWRLPSSAVHVRARARSNSRNQEKRKEALCGPRCKPVGHANGRRRRAQWPPNNRGSRCGGDAFSSRLTLLARNPVACKFNGGVGQRWSASGASRLRAGGRGRSLSQPSSSGAQRLVRGKRSLRQAPVAAASPVQPAPELGRSGQYHRQRPPKRRH